MGGGSPVPAETIGIPKETVEPDARPRKKRKLEIGVTKEPELHVSEFPSTKLPTPPATLPSFPLPTRPDAPSKSDLALLGLDRALVDAEVVDSAATTPIQFDSRECSTGLSERTRRRLQEIGINELFAGSFIQFSPDSRLTSCAVQTTLLPFLLNLERNQNRSYVPYDAPRDVCVSAPTGSGKTLAYVLPIIEVCSVI